MKEEEIWHDLESETPTIVNFILRQEKHFLVLKSRFYAVFSQMYLIPCPVAAGPDTDGSKIPNANY